MEVREGHSASCTVRRFKLQLPRQDSSQLIEIRDTAPWAFTLAQPIEHLDVLHVDHGVFPWNSALRRQTVDFAFGLQPCD